MADGRQLTRRRTLAAVATSIALAGCAGGDESGDDGETGDETNGSDDSSGSDDTGGDDTDDTGDPPDDGDGPLADVPDELAFEPIVTGLQAPVAFADLPQADVQWVLEQPGRIRTIADGSLADAPVLDLTEAITAGGEKGLLGVVLHPDFADNRRIFLRYSAPAREGTPDDYSHTFVLAEFQASGDGRSIDPASERTILQIPEPQGNHNAGDIAFGPDGFLYVPVGDGGAANDQGRGHVEDWYAAVDGGNGQDVTENVLGSILRIDVDGDDPYAVPDSNPLVGEDGLDEHYAWGLRNPWRLSFDGEDCYVADVGQNQFEEVNLLTAGGNYGWNVREGAHCFQADSCPDATPDDVRGGEALVDPVIEYPHSGDGISGISVIGGHVYRGSALSGLEGVYVFADFQPFGELFVAAEPGGDGEADGRWPTASVTIRDIGLQALYSFGQDRDGELYALGRADDVGGVWRLTPA